MALEIVLSVEGCHASRRGEWANQDLGKSILARMNGVLMPFQVVAVSEALRAAWDGALVRSDVDNGVMLAGFC